jgi:exopolysaccharide biosynthesis predicted pyruvyltransferase EpsI
MDSSYLDIKTYLSHLDTSRPIYFYPNPGNAGDALISYSTYQLFKSMKIPYLQYHPEANNLDDSILIYGGGGNLVPNYTNARNIIVKWHKRVHKLIVFPHTINGHKELLSDLGYNVDIITREPISYNYVKSVNKKSNIYLMHDLAFSLNLKEILSVNIFNVMLKMCTMLPMNKILQGYKINIFYLITYLRSILSETSLCNCFRIDIEKTDLIPPKDNLDISHIFAYGTDENKSFYSSYYLIRYLNRFDKIRTNRLHICIAGALLKKEVEFYPNNYYKCEAIYNYSMRGVYKNVKYMG